MKVLLPRRPRSRACRRPIGRLGLAVATLWTAGAPSAQAIALHDILLCIRFDRELKTDMPLGLRLQRIEGEPALRPGRLGRAVLTGSGLGRLALPTGACYPQRGEGTVELWLMAVDWDGPHPPRKSLVTFGGAFQMAAQAGWLTVEAQPEEVPPTRLEAPIDAWKKGQWHHVVLTFDRWRYTLYIDGVRSRWAGSTGVPGAPERLEFGTGADEAGRTAIDEVFIYDRALVPEEVRAAFHRVELEPYRPDIPQRHAPPLVVEADHLLLDQQVLVRAKSHPWEPPVVPRTYRFELIGPDGKTARSESVETREMFTPWIPMKLDDLPVGPVGIAATEFFQGRATAEAVASIEKLSTDTWTEAARLGRDPAVPPPWSPVTVAGNQVAVWGRRYDLADSGLPRQITSAGRPLLAGPIDLWSTAGSAPLAWSFQGVEVATRQPDAVQIVSRWFSGTLTAELEARIEYDGLIYTTLTLRPLLPAAELGPLTLRIPLESTVGRWMQVVSMEPEEPAGVTGLAVPAGQGRVWSSAFRPSLWIGDHQAGLAWFCEGPDGWDLSRDAPPLELWRDGPRLDVRVHWLRQGRLVSSPLAFKFGLMATPVRPREAAARRWHVAADCSEGNVVLKPALARGYNVGYPALMAPAAFANECQEAAQAQAGLYVLLYPSHMPCNVAERYRYGRPWANVPLQAMSVEDTAGSGAALWTVSPASPWGDFVVFTADYLARRYPIGGVYFDNADPTPDQVEARGNGYTDPEGRRRPTLQILATREVFKRTCKRLAARGRTPPRLVANASRPVAPVLSHADILIVGRDLAPSTDPYSKRLSADEAAVWLAPGGFGLRQVLLPRWPERYAPTAEDTDNLLGFAALHDVGVWSVRLDPKRLEAHRKLQEQFKWSAATFMGWWSSDCPVQTDTPSVRASVYQSDPAWVVVAGNFSERACQARVALAGPSAERFRKWRQLLTDRPQTGEGPVATLRFAPYAFIMLAFD